MAKVVAIMSMYLDGYVADANDGVRRATTSRTHRSSSGIRPSSPVWVSRLRSPVH
jgi:hypothetical protein